MALSSGPAVVASLLKANIRYFKSKPSVLLGIAGCLVLSAFSLYALHLLAFQIVSDTRNQFSQQGFAYVIPLNTKTEEEYFQLRERWFLESSDMPYQLVPVLEGTIQHQGESIPLLGIDSVATVVLNASANPNSFASEQSLLTSNSALAFGDFTNRGDFIQGMEISRVAPSTNPYLLTDIGTAQDALDRRGQLDAVWLLAIDPPQQEWMDWIIPGMVEHDDSRSEQEKLSAFDARPLAWWNPADDFNRAIAFQLAILSLLAIAVAAFVIYQITHTAAFHRRRELERMLTVGVSRAQYAWAFMLTYGWVALASCFLGIAIGQLLLELALPTDAYAVSSTPALVAITKALVVTLVVTLVILWWAHTRQKKKLPPWLIFSMGLFSAGLAVTLIVTPSGLLGAEGAIVFACLANIGLVVPLVLFALKASVKRFATGSNLSKMHQRAFVDTLHVIRPIIFALSFALANAIGIDLMISSFKTNFLDMLDTRLTDGVYVTNLKNVDLNRLQGIPGVEDSRRYSKGSGQIARGKFDFQIAELDTWQAARYGYTHEEPPMLMINEIASQKLDLALGDRIVMQLTGGEKLQQSIDHIYRDYGVATPEFILSAKLVNMGNYPTNRVLLRGDTEQIASYIEQLQSEFPFLFIRRDSQIREIAEYVFDQTFFLTRIMVFVGLAVAVVGLVCSFTVLLSTRDVEFRLLLAMGLSKLELLRTNLWQCLRLGIVTVVCALPLSVLIAWILCEVVHPQAFGWTIDLQFDSASVIYPGLFCLIAAITAGFIPLIRTLNEVTVQPVSDIG